MRTVRSILRALLNRKLGRLDEPGNPYGDLSFRNVLECYRADKRFQVRAAALWIVGKLLPTNALRNLIGEKPRKVHYAEMGQG